MEAVEINAGGWYLRALRADDRLSDVPALNDFGPKQLGEGGAAAYVERADAGWVSETLFTWAVCVPTTGELVAVIGVAVGAGGHVAGGGLDSAPVFAASAREGYDEALAAAIDPVRRFAAGALGIEVAEEPVHALP